MKSSYVGLVARRNARSRHDTIVAAGPKARLGTDRRAHVECAPDRLETLVAAMRKLLVLCFGVLKTGRPFDAAIAMGG